MSALAATRPILEQERDTLHAYGSMGMGAAIRCYPNSPNPAKVDRWTVAGPGAPNEVWIHRANPWNNETGYFVGHRHAGGTFPRLFAPLEFEQPASDPRWGYTRTHAATFIEAYGLAAQLVRAYSGRA
jgi:hypothetical protein